MESLPASASIHVWAARSGHGATTVAGALGVVLNAPVRSCDQDAFEWMWGKPRGALFGGSIAVRDAGLIAGSLPKKQTNVVVLRGPCSLALRGLAHRSYSVDHLILLREPWRPLRPQDVEDALAIGIDAEVQFSSRVARLADAGLLSARAVDLPEFSDLKAWAKNTWVAYRPLPPETDGASQRSNDVKPPPS